MTLVTDDVDVAVRRLRRGGLVAIPTETVYGLGANAEDDAAVARIFEVKGRPAGHPLIVHIAPGVARRLGRRRAAGSGRARRRVLARPADAPARPVSPGARRRHGRARQRRVAGAGTPTDRGAAAAVRAGDRRTLRQPLRAGQPDDRRARRRRPRPVPRSPPDVVLDGGPARSASRARSSTARWIRRSCCAPAGSRPTTSSACSTRSSPTASGPSRAAGMLAAHYAPSAEVVLVPDRHRPTRRWRPLEREGLRVAVIDHPRSRRVRPRSSTPTSAPPMPPAPTASSPCSPRRRASATPSATASPRRPIRVLGDRTPVLQHSDGVKHSDGRGGRGC